MNNVQSQTQRSSGNYTGKDRSMIRELVNSLPASKRALIRLKFWRALSDSEISQLTGIPASRVYEQIQRVLGELKIDFKTSRANHPGPYCGGARAIRTVANILKIPSHQYSDIGA